MTSVLHRGHSLQARLVAPGVPIDDAGVDLLLERFERFEGPAPVELVLQVPEEPLHAGVVQAGRLPRHALRDAHLLEAPLVGQLPVLPALVGVEERGPFEARPQVFEHLQGLGEVGAPRHRPRHDLVVVEVHHRRQVGLGPRHLELGDVGGELGHRGLGGEVAVEDVAGGLPPLAPVGVVPLAAYAAAKALLAHQLERGLPADGKPPLGPEGHRHLAVPHAVGRAGERLAHQGANVGPPVGPGAPPSRVAVVGALGEPELVEHELERVFAPQRVRRLRSISSAKALIRFWISSSSSRTRASGSSSREENAGSGFLGRPLDLGRRASGPPSR